MNIKKNHPRLYQTLIWLIPVLYTAILPEAIFVYDAIAEFTSKTIVSSIPVFITFLFVIAYIMYGLTKNKLLVLLVHITPCCTILLLLISLRYSPSKLIHIPEYMVMSVILYVAFSMDLKSNKIYILVFLCASLLGIVDELLQGIHPERFFGLNDILLNSVSAFAGVIMIRGLNLPADSDEIDFIHYQPFIIHIIVITFGVISSVGMCFYLYLERADHNSSVTLPSWLMGLNTLFILIALGLIAYQKIVFKGRLNAHEKNDSNMSRKKAAARVWVFPPLAILVCIHGIIWLIRITQWDFM